MGERATPAPAAEDAGAVISTLIAKKCNRVLGQELMREEETLHRGPSRATEGGELRDCKPFNVFQP